MVTTTTITRYPWQPDSTKTALRAIGDLGAGLMGALKTQRGIHTETLMTVVGALAGFAAQNAALTSITAATPSVKPRSFAIVQSTTGGIFLFGDAINAFLFPEAGSVLPLAALISGAALSAGAKQEELPNLGEIAAHIASVVGTPEFGKLRVPPGVSPQLEPLAALRKFWPQTLAILARPPTKPLFRQQEAPLQEIHWPIILGLVASQFIKMSQNALHARISATLVMESAVITSKVDPETIEPGKWRIPTGEGGPAIARLRK
jgi:hypothetical protein